MPNGELSIGYLFIAPQLKFDCHGSITSWHSLTYFKTIDAALDVLFHDITFQLWRPSAEDNRVYYSFIGSNIARFIGNEIRAGRTILEDGTQFSNLTSTPSAQDRLQFQPGDVIGWYIHTLVQATSQPLSIVYRHATSDDNAVDLFSTVISDSDFAATPPPCDVAICSTNTTLIPSVIPYITVEYGKATYMHSKNMQVDHINLIWVASVAPTTCLCLPVIVSHHSSHNPVYYNYY